MKKLGNWYVWIFYILAACWVADKAIKGNGWAAFLIITVIVGLFVEYWFIKRKKVTN